MAARLLDSGRRAESGLQGVGGRGRIGGRDGIVVFGLLLLIVGSFATAVAIGVLINRASQGPPAPPVPRDLRYASEIVEVRFGALTAERFAPGERLWVVSAAPGEVAVFQDSVSNRIVGFARSDILQESPPPASRGLGRRMPLGVTKRSR